MLGLWNSRCCMGSRARTPPRSHPRPGSGGGREARVSGRSRPSGNDEIRQGTIVVRDRNQTFQGGADVHRRMGVDRWRHECERPVCRDVAGKSLHEYQVA